MDVDLCMPLFYPVRQTGSLRGIRMAIKVSNTNTFAILIVCTWVHSISNGINCLDKLVLTTIHLQIYEYSGKLSALK